MVVELKREELENQKLSELQQVFELYVLIKQNPWNSNLDNFKEIKENFYYRRIRQIPFWKWKVLEQKRSEIRAELMALMNSDKWQKSVLLDLFVDKIHRGEQEVMLVLDEIKEIFESLDENWMELFSISLSSYCQGYLEYNNSHYQHTQRSHK